MRSICLLYNGPLTVVYYFEMYLSSEEESYSAELAEVEYPVFLSLAKEASTFPCIFFIMALWKVNGPVNNRYFFDPLVKALYNDPLNSSSE